MIEQIDLSGKNATLVFPVAGLKHTTLCVATNLSFITGSALD
jgi:hypothetical protein